MILTRLFMPEAFGLMALVNVYLTALVLLSDIGVGPSIIQHARGEDADFLNTAWTIQVGRGVLLWLCGWALAGVMAKRLDHPQLAVLLPIASVSALIDGFASTARFTLTRRMQLGRLMCLELGSHVGGIVFMVVWALVSPSLWALVMGGVFAALIRMVASHFLIPGFRNRFCWDSEAAHALVHFGKWIFLSTMLTFLVHRGDRLMLDRVLTLTQLGVYGIAATLTQIPYQLVGATSGRVLFPLYSRFSDSNEELLTTEIARVRTRIGLASVAVHSVLAIAAVQIVRLFWPEAFWGAGPMAQILAIGGIGAASVATLQPVLLACGDSRSHLLSNCISAVIFLACVFLGQHYGGVTGIVIGLAASPILHYPAVAFLAAKHKAWTPSADMPALIAIVVLGFLVAGTW